MRTTFAPDAVARFALAIAALLALLAIARTAFGGAGWSFWDDAPLEGDVALGMLRTWIVVGGSLAIAALSLDFSGVAPWRRR